VFFLCVCVCWVCCVVWGWGVVCGCVGGGGWCVCGGCVWGVGCVWCGVCVCGVCVWCEVCVMCGVCVWCVWCVCMMCVCGVCVCVWCVFVNLRSYYKHARARWACMLIVRSYVPLRQPEDGQYRSKHIVVHYIVIKYTSCAHSCV